MNSTQSMSTHPEAGEARTQTSSDDPAGFPGQGPANGTEHVHTVFGKEADPTEADADQMRRKASLMEHV